VPGFPPRVGPPQWRTETPIVTSADAVRVVAIQALRDELDDIDEQMTVLMKGRALSYSGDFTKAFEALIKHREAQCARIERILDGSG